MTIKSCLIKRKKQQAPVLTFGSPLKNSYNGSLWMFLLLMSMGVFFTGCQEPETHTDCGAYQVEINGECECEEGYHWNESHTDCQMDTTSHNFIWEIDTLGSYGSYLNDVAIVDENNIWVVGLIRTNEFDSTSMTNYTDYNAAHWDGIEWELIKVLSGHTANTGIQYISENNIWVASGLPIHWDGSEWTLYHLWDMGVLGPNDGGVKHIWGSTPDDIYFVGLNGSIVHYDGSGFTKMMSGPELPIRDIWGVIDESTGAETVMMVASNKIYNPQGKAILMIQDGVVTEEIDAGLPDNLNGLWFDNDTKYIVGAGVFSYDPDLSIWVEEAGHPSYPYKTSIRGTNINNLFSVGAFGHISHFNGLSWKHYWSDGEVPNFTGAYDAVSVAYNVVAAVGWVGNKGIILRGINIE